MTLFRSDSLTGPEAFAPKTKTRDRMVHEPPRIDPQSATISDALKRADLARDLDEDTDNSTRLKEMVVAAEQAPRAAASDLSQHIEAMRAHLERRRKLLIAAIDEYHTHCDQAAAALKIMVENVAAVNTSFANAMRPTPINPETAPHDDGTELAQTQEIKT